MALLNLLDPFNIFGSIFNPTPTPAPAPVTPLPAPTPAASASLDLENVSLGTSTWLNAAPPAGWATDNNIGKIEVGFESAYGAGLNGTNKVIELETTPNAKDNLYTMIDSKVGNDVVISFDLAGRAGHLTGNDSAIKVIVDGKVIATIVPEATTFAAHVFAVSGTGKPMRVEFKSVDHNGYGAVLDNIHIEQVDVTNQQPIAADDTASGKQNADVVIATSTLLANDKDADGDTLKIFSVQDAVNGTVKIEGDKVIFTPNAGYSGPASFTYTAFDGKDGTSVATVNLAIESVIPPNNAPVTTDDSASGSQNADVVIDKSTLLANDQDADGDTLSIVSVQDAVNGTVKIEGDKVIFTPNTGYSGPASFTYTAFDGKDGTSVATVNLAIEAVVLENQAPVASNDAISGFKNNEVVISPTTLLGNDYDPEGGAITGAGLGDAVNGTVLWDGTNVIFTPTAGYSGPASFTYTIADDKGLESTATVNLTIENNASEANITNGTAAADSLIDTGGDDVINGLAGNDKIAATDGNDTIVGGAGNDIMQGGAGADTFTWTLADTTATGIEIDTLYADGNDKLNMKDLLVGEANTANALDNYLHFSFENGDTVVSVSTKGTFADNNATGAINNGTVDQKIVLSGFDLTAGNTLSDVQVIQNMLNGQHLITD